MPISRPRSASPAPVKTAPKTGLEMAAALRDALSTAGMPRTSTMNGAELTGWTTHWGSTGFSLRAKDDGEIEWHMVVSGKPLLAYREYQDAWNDEVHDLHEPINPQSLAPRLKAVLESLGLTVRSVTYAGHQTMWDDDVTFNAVTDHPQWLEREACAPRERFRA